MIIFENLKNIIYQLKKCKRKYKRKLKISFYNKFNYRNIFNLIK